MLSVPEGWISESVSGNGEVTLDALCLELAGGEIDVHGATIGLFLHWLGLSKSLRASA